MEKPSKNERLSRLRAQIRRIEQTVYPDRMQADKQLVLNELHRRVSHVEQLKSDAPDHP